MKDILPSLVIAAISGGVVARFIDYAYTWVKDALGKRSSAKALIDAHLDPILKAADAVIGKTKSLAGRDFELFMRHDKAAENAGFNPDLIGLVYLYARLWGKFEILARQSLGVSLSSDKRAVKLQQFVACLGSPQIRLVNRTHQNAIGELTTELSPTGELRTIGVVEFQQKIGGAAPASVWCEPLVQLLARSKEKAIRQQLLVYGVVVHALVDTLDPKHQSTHPREPYPNKLSEKSKHEVKRLVFKEYLNSVGAINRYTQ